MYGILVTQKSYLLGLRGLALQHHAHYLAHRIVGTRLPPELCDEIGAELGALYLQGAERMWKRMKHDPMARTKKFDFWMAGTDNPTESEKSGVATYMKLAKRDVPEGTIVVLRMMTQIDLPGTQHKVQRYVHLSASLTIPSVSMLVPGLAACSGGPAVKFANKMLVANQAGGAAQQSAEGLRIDLNDAGSVARVVQLDDVEASIRGWNQKLVEGFVEQLALEVVAVRDEKGSYGRIKPELRLLQRWHWT